MTIRNFLQVATLMVLLLVTACSQQGPAPAPTVAATPASLLAEGPRYRLTYPATWEPVSNPPAVCGGNVECVLALSPVGAADSSFIIMRNEIPEAGLASIEEHGVERVLPMLMSRNATGPDDQTLQEPAALEVGGRPALLRTFTRPARASEGGRVYMMDGIVVNDRDLYVFVLTTPNADTLARYKPEVENILTSVQFLE